MTTDTEGDLEAALRAHAIETGGISDDSVIVAWTIVGEAIDPNRDDGVRVFYARNESIDPILELGLLTARQNDVNKWCRRSDEDDEP